MEGSVDFYVDGDWITAEQGSCLHIPPGVPHACTLTNETNKTNKTRMLMIFQPAGFDLFLEELGRMNEKELNDPEKMEALSLKYDIINMGDLPERNQ